MKAFQLTKCRSHSQVSTQIESIGVDDVGEMEESCKEFSKFCFPYCLRFFYFSELMKKDHSSDVATVLLMPEAVKV